MKNNDNETTNNLLDRRERLKELRKKKAENEEFIKEIDNLNTVCYALSENIRYESEKNESLKKEIQFRKNHLEKIEKEYASVVDKQNPDSKNYVIAMKNKLIRRKLEEILIEKIPELEENSNKSEQKIENEFKNLVFDHVLILYTINDNSDNAHNRKDEKQPFKISKNSTFRNLKKIACQFWDLDNDNDYLITDDSEALICNEDSKINDFLQDYSVLQNQLRLVLIPSLKQRTKLLSIQENRMKENNKLGQKRGDGDNNVDLDINHDSSLHKIKEFFNEYPGLKPFTLTSDDKTEGEGGEKKREDAQAQAKNIETSFWMLLLLILFFVLNIYFIYGTRDIGRNNIKISYVKNLFDNSNVNNYTSLYVYLVTQIGFSFMNTTKYTHQNSQASDNAWIDNSYRFFSGQPYWQEILNTTSGNMDLQVDPLYNYINFFQNSSQNFISVSSIHIINQRVNSIPCSTSLIVSNILSALDTCYNIYYSTDTRQTNLTNSTIDTVYRSGTPDILSVIQEMTVFKDATAANISLDVNLFK